MLKSWNLDGLTPYDLSVAQGFAFRAALPMPKRLRTRKVHKRKIIEKMSVLKSVQLARKSHRLKDMPNEDLKDIILTICTATHKFCGTILTGLL